MVDRTTFVGALVPSEIKPLGKLLGSLQGKQGEAVLKGIIDGMAHDAVGVAWRGTTNLLCLSAF